MRIGAMGPSGSIGLRLLRTPEFMRVGTYSQDPKGPRWTLKIFAPEETEIALEEFCLAVSSILKGGLNGWGENELGEAEPTPPEVIKLIDDVRNAYEIKDGKWVRRKS